MMTLQKLFPLPLHSTITMMMMMMMMMMMIVVMKIVVMTMVMIELIHNCARHDVNSRPISGVLLQYCVGSYYDMCY